jgi:hypothetical protein
MSLEQKLSELTEAVRILTETLSQSQHEKTPVDNVSGDVVKVAIDTPVKKAVKKDPAPGPVAETVERKEETVASKEETVASKEETVEDFSALPELTVAFAKKNGKDALLGVLARYNAGRFGELDKKHYPAYLVDITAQ